MLVTYKYFPVRVDRDRDRSRAGHEWRIQRGGERAAGGVDGQAGDGVINEIRYVDKMFRGIDDQRARTVADRKR